MLSRHQDLSVGSWSEAPLWANVTSGWRRLGGCFRREGFSLEWHDLKGDQPVNWGETIHPESVEVCLNLRGHASLRAGADKLELKDKTTTFYVRGRDRIAASRATGQPHEFLTLELSFDFLRTQLDQRGRNLHPLVAGVVKGDTQAAGVGGTRSITTRQEELLKTLRSPPVQAAAQTVWFRGKALELMSEILFVPDEGELFCTRQKRVAHERVDKVIQILRANMEKPPSLEDIGRRVACSPFYLSRTFSQETGTTIPQYLRRIRMEKAAELLKTGHFNVTEVALEVGYNSLSHFSQAFCQTMGSCPAIFQAREQKKQALTSAPAR